VVADGDVVAVGPGTAALFDTTADALAGESLSSLLPDLSPLADLEDAEAAVTVSRDGVRRRFRVVVRPAGPGELGEWWVSLADVTEGTDPWSAAERTAAVVAALSTPACLTDESGRVTWVSDPFTDVFGYSQADVAREALHFSALTSDDDSAAVRDLVQSLADGDAVRGRLDVDAVTRDGRTVPVELSVALRPSDGEFRGMAALLRDVSVRERREELLGVIDRALRHDLRTHVNAITGYADAVAERVDDETTREYLAHVDESATWLGKLGETVRTLQGAIEEHHGGDDGADTATIVDSVAATFDRRFPAATVTTHVTTDAQVAAGTALEYVIANLVENAIVHHDGDAPTVDVWVADAPEPGWVDIHVEDDGPGIPAEERAVVVGEADITQLTHGTGVGLWVSRWIVDVFDGELRIEDDEGPGTVVTVRLRRAG
jgi:PAS domain S-box-containing protein